MNRTASASDFFVVGGDLGPNTPSYVKRPADDELFNLALAGEFCYVLTPRQMGKSSLMNRTARRLEKKAIHTASIDLSGIGLVQIDAWYLGLLTELTRVLRLSVDPQAWWQERVYLGQAQRFTHFMRDVVLAEIKGQVVIFIDELDTTLKLDFRDDFFAAIRAMYNARAREPEFNRLTFILLGVASPSDLIKDRTRTPFNIGQAVTLQDFSQADATVLQARLEAIYPGQGEAIFSRIYHWTNGHPYLTQKLCRAAATTAEAFWTHDRIDSLVEKLFLTREVSKEDNLKFVRDMILDHPQQCQMLDIYRKVYKGKNIANDEQSPAQNQLNLSGLVKVGNGYLRVRNEVYRHVFNSDWIKANTQQNWKLIGAYAGLVVAVIAIIILGVILWYDNIKIPNLTQEAMKYDFYQTTTTSEERVTRLATLFELQGFLRTQDYDNEAKELFFGLQTRQEQFALFDVKSDRVVIVIRGLYTTLADVDDTGSTDPLLGKIGEALNRLDTTTETEKLKDEISRWLEGRKLARQGQDNEALTKYNEAIALNGENLATLYERAKIRIKLGQYQQALSDLDQVMAIAGRSPLPTPTLLPLTPTLVTMPPTRTPSPAGMIMTTTLPSTFTEMPLQSIPTATPTPASITSAFATTGQIISAVRSLINNNPNLANNLTGAAQTEYANLREFGLVPTTAPTATDFAYRIRVTNANTNQPIQGARVVIQMENGNLFDYLSDADGWVEILMPSTEQRATLIVEADGYDRKTMPNIIFVARDWPLFIQLEPANATISPTATQPLLIPVSPTLVPTLPSLTSTPPLATPSLVTLSPVLVQPSTTPFPFMPLELGDRLFQKTTHHIITILVAVVDVNNTPIDGLKIVGDHVPSGQHAESALSDQNWSVANCLDCDYIKQGNLKFEPGPFTDGVWNVYLADENGTQLSPVVSLSYSADPEQWVWDFIIFQQTLRRS